MKVYEIHKILTEESKRQIYWHGGSSRGGEFYENPSAGAIYITDDIGDAYTYSAQYSEKEGVITPLYLKKGLSILDLTKKENLKKYGYKCGDCETNMDIMVDDLRSGSYERQQFFKDEGFDVVKHIDTNNSRYRGFMKTWVVFDSKNLEIAPRPDMAWNEIGEGESIGEHFYDYPIIGSQDI